MKINEVSPTIRYRVYMSYADLRNGPNTRKEGTWTGYANSQSNAAEEAEEAFKVSGMQDLSVVKVRKLKMSDSGIKEGINLTLNKYQRNPDYNTRSEITPDSERENRNLDDRIAAAWAKQWEKSGNDIENHKRDWDANVRDAISKRSKVSEEEVLDEWSQTDKGIKSELIKQGYSYLGAGVDQTAYLEPDSGLVLKIFGTHLNTKGSGGSMLSESQKMFVTWAEYCMNNPNNPYLPEFYGFEKFVFNDHTYFQIRQEHLTPIPEVLGEHVWVLADSFDELDYYSIEFFLRDFQTYYSESYSILHQILGETGLRSMIQTCKQLYDISKQHNWVFDLHEANFMARGNTPVIIDPWLVHA